MEIRRAKTQDANKIKDLLNQVLSIHHNGRPDLFKADCRKYTDSELDALIEDDTRPIFVADDNGVLGYAFCMIQERRGDNILTDMKSLYIDDLCVDENARGKRIGTALYEFVLNYARQIGCYNVTLNVWECNDNARKFYDSQGLKPQKTTLEKIL